MEKKWAFWNCREWKKWHFLKFLTAWFEIRYLPETTWQVSRWHVLEEAATVSKRIARLPEFGNSLMCELIVSISRPITRFFRCVYRLVISFNTGNMFDFSYWSPDGSCYSPYTAAHFTLWTFSRLLNQWRFRVFHRTALEYTQIIIPQLL